MGTDEFIMDPNATLKTGTHIIDTPASTFDTDQLSIDPNATLETQTPSSEAPTPTSETPRHLDANQVTIDLNATLETPTPCFETPKTKTTPTPCFETPETKSTPTPCFETPRTTSTPRAMTRADCLECAKEWCASLLLRDTEWTKLTTEQKERAIRLISPDFSWSPQKLINNQNRYKTTFRDEFEKFLKQATVPWKTATYFNPIDRLTYRSLFFEDEDIEKYMVIRRQRSGLCCLHASVVFQHYLNCYRNGTANHTTFDISSYIRGQLPVETKLKFLRTGAVGTNAYAFFKTITGVKEGSFVNFAPENVNDSRARLDFYKTYVLMFFSNTDHRGPALISDFAQGETFSNKDEGKVTYEGIETKFLSKDNGEKNKHAMVVIGMYVKEDGILWFLVQNWWKGSYFQEISAEYFMSCGGILRFLKNGTDVSLKNDPSTVNDIYSEAATPVSERDDDFDEESCDGSGIYFCGDDHYDSDDGHCEDDPVHYDYYDNDPDELGPDGFDY